MVVQLRTKRRCLSESERATLLAVAEAALPEGNVLPGAGRECVDRVENFLATSRPLALGYRGALHALDAIAWTRHLRPFARLDVARRCAILDGLRRGDYARRWLVRGLLTPLKIAHFDDPAFYRQIGCVYDFERGRDDRPRVLQERVHRARELPAGETIECDVVVIGTGAGGAPAARELAERGHAVVMLEEGEYFTRADFTGRAIDMQRRLYRDLGATVSVGNVGIPIPVGKAVGGTTTINSGTCYRVPDRVLGKWRDEHGLVDFTPDYLAPYYEKVEQVLQVAPAAREHLGGIASVIARGCDALGYRRHKPLLRNAPDCDGKGVCVFGCPTDAKRSTNVSYVPLALRAGAELFTGARALRILHEDGRATGVEVESSRGGTRFTVRARAVVVACGTLFTPLLLERSGLAGASGQLGHNLSIHPASAVYAWFDGRTGAQAGIPQGYAIEEFHEEGILFEGGTVPLEMGTANVPLLGPRYVELMETYDRSAMFGFMIEDRSRGRVRATRGGRPFITYVLGDEDVARLKRAVEILARVFLAAGARLVLPMVHGFDELRSEADLGRFRSARLSARDFDLSAYHPLGTARMGIDRRSSVVGPDHALHDVPNVFVMDGSAVPSSLAVNPQLTIMALATRAAEGLSARL
jgi:choline dehydrogenase-like flavoprotein